MPESEPKTITPTLGPAQEILRRNGDFRVWSVIVSLFGDLARGRGDRISGAILSALCTRMDIRPEAMRVALHRLRKDNWVNSERTGRTSVYRLSDTGFAESLAARGRIYATEIAMPKDWSLCVGQPLPAIQRIKRDQDSAANGALVVTSGVWLMASSDVSPDANLLTFSSGLPLLPDWIKAAVAPPDLTQAYQDLSEDFDNLAGLLNAATPMDTMDIAALRILIVHNWRRLVLRHAPLPADFYADDWPGLTCRRQVGALLARLPRPSLADLNA